MNRREMIRLAASQTALTAMPAAAPHSSRVPRGPSRINHNPDQFEFGAFAHTDGIWRSLQRRQNRCSD